MLCFVETVSQGHWSLYQLLPQCVQNASDTLSSNHVMLIEFDAILYVSDSNHYCYSPIYIRRTSSDLHTTVAAVVDIFVDLNLYIPVSVLLAGAGLSRIWR